MARLIGDAYIVIHPQTNLFGPEAEAGIKKGLAALKATVNVKPKLDKGAAAAVAAEMRAAADKLDIDVAPKLNEVSAANVKASIDALLRGIKTAGISEQVKLAVNPEQLAAVKTSIDAFMRDETFDIKPQIDSAALTAAEAKLSSFLSEQVRLTISPEQLAAVKASIDSFMHNELLDVKVMIDPASLTAAESKVNEFLHGIKTADVSVQLNAEQMQAARASIDAFIRDAENPVDIPVQANITPALTRIDELAAKASVLQTQLMNLRANVNDTAAEAKLAALSAQTTAFVQALAKAGDAANFEQFEAKLLGIQAAYEKVQGTQKSEDDELAKQATLWNKLGLSGPGALVSLHEMLNITLPQVKLFNGAIGMLYTATVSAVTGADKTLPTFASHLVDVATKGHLTAEAGIEIAAVWGPATIALAAFAAAATPAILTISKQLINMNTAAQGTGRAFASLATANASVTAAVKPTVMEAFGIALFAVQNHASDLASVMHSLGQGIDQFAAKAAIAFDSSAGDKFFKTGSADALALMDSFQQLGSILGTLMKAVPGYAEVLLNFGNSILGLAADAAKGIEPLLAEFLKLHGALLYGGLAGTAIALAFSKIVAGATVASAAVLKFVTTTVGLSETGAVAKGISYIGLSLQALGGPAVIAGVGLVTGAIAAIVIYLKAANTAASEFNKTIQSSLSNTAVTALPQTLANDLAQANAKVTASTATYTQAVQKATSAVAASNSRTGDFTLAQRAAGSAMDSAAENAAQYAAGQQQLSQQSKNLNLNLGAIAATFGTNIPGALALANGAQVTSNQLLGQGASNWAVISTMINGYVAELKVMTPGTGALNQALNALNVTQSQGVQDAQKLGQAYQQWISIVTGGDQAFTTFEQGFAELDSAMSKANTGGASFTVTVGNLRDKFQAVGASMNGTSTAALAVRQAFDQQVTAAAQVYSNLQTMSVVSGSTTASTNELAHAGRDLVAQLLPLAAGSKTATAEVYALAQVVGYTGPDSFAKLAQWLGNTKGAEADLDSQTTKLTVSSANLTQAAKNLASAMANEVSGGEAAAIIQATHLTSIQGQLAAAVEGANGKFTSAAQTLAGQYYEALLKAGDTTDQARGQVDAFLQKMDATPGVINTVNAALAKLPKDVSIKVDADTSGATSKIQSFQGMVNSLHGTTVQIGVQAVGPTAVVQAFLNGMASGGVVGGIPHAASGMTVKGSGPSGKDSQLVLAAPGEMIVPTSHVPAFHDQARRASIPGFNGNPATRSKTGTVASARHFADGGIPEPVFGFGTAARSFPYSFAEPVYAGGANASAVANGGLQAMTRYQAATIIDLMQKQNKLLQQMPYAYAQAISQAQANGVRYGWFGVPG